MFQIDKYQLFLSFLSASFDSSITHLQNALQQLSSWRTPNRLTVDVPPRLNYYSLDSKSNLTRYITPHLIPPTLLATLVSSMINILLSPTKFQPSPMLAITTLDSFVASIRTLIPPQRAPLPPPSFTPNSITVILCIITYLSLRLPASNTFRTLFLVQMLKL